MVHLYGVVHGASQTDIIMGRTTHVNLRPSNLFLQDIAQYPKGTKIGIENLTSEAWERIMIDLINSNPCTVFFDPDLSYWNYIIEQCKKNEHEIIFLENESVWIKYNKALKEFIEQNSKIEEICNEERGINLNYHMKLCEFEDTVYTANIRLKQIHQIERDEIILNNIKNDMDIVIVGVAHSDFWIANSQFIKETQSIIFDSYSTDVLIDNTFSPFFTKDAIPKPELVYSRKSLERAINLINTGRITQDTPDYVGIWDVTEPSKGYFELFITNEENGVISGTIEDCLGSATFEGVQKDGKFNFTKRYTQHDMDAIRANIVYNSKRNGKGFTGYYNREGDGFKIAFCMIQSPKENPLDLTRYWAEVNLKEEVVSDTNSDELPF